MHELTRYLAAHVETLTADVPLRRLVTDGRLSRAEVLGIASLAVVGGWQPLAEVVGNALYWLLARPAAAQQLRDGDESLDRTAVDELIRLEAPIPFTARVSTHDVELPGGTVPAGARVLAVIAAANRDPAVFAAAEELLLDRSPNPHLAFGAGGHFCLGAPLVREASALLLPALLRAFPALHGAPEPPAWDSRLIPRRLKAFPIGLSDAG
jgi:cytochrome P450